MTGTHTALVLAGGEVEHPMHAVPDAPVASHGPVEHPRRASRAASAHDPGTIDEPYLTHGLLTPPSHFYIYLVSLRWSLDRRLSCITLLLNLCIGIDAVLPQRYGTVCEF